MAKATDRFITSTAAEVTPVSEIGPYEFTPGEVCRTLIADFTATVNPHTAAAELDSYQKCVAARADRPRFRSQSLS